MRSQSSQVRCGSVSQDWLRPLPGEKTESYVKGLQSLEIAYTMFSVSLDELRTTSEKVLPGLFG